MARSLHFLPVLFISIHVLMVFVAGFRNRIRAMITGRAIHRRNESIFGPSHRSGATHSSSNLVAFQRLDSARQSCKETVDTGGLFFAGPEHAEVGGHTIPAALRTRNAFFRRP
jgi:hypothetical protein